MAGIWDWGLGIGITLSTSALITNPQSLIPYLYLHITFPAQYRSQFEWQDLIPFHPLALCCLAADSTSAWTVSYDTVGVLRGC